MALCSRSLSYTEFLKNVQRNMRALHWRLMYELDLPTYLTFETVKIHFALAAILRALLQRA